MTPLCPPPAARTATALVLGGGRLLCLDCGQIALDPAQHPCVEEIGWRYNALQLIWKHYAKIPDAAIRN